MRSTKTFGPGPSAKMIPVTMGLIVTLTISYFVGWASSTTPVLEPLMFKGNWSAPWTALTYPWAYQASGALIWFALSMLWLYSIGGEVEKEVGPKFYLGLFLVLALLGAVGISLGAAVVGMGAAAVATGSLLPAAGITAVWASRRPNCQVCFWGLPVAAKWIGLFVAVSVMVAYGAGAPVVGLFAILPCVLGALFGSGKLPIRFPNQLSNNPALARTKAERAKEQKEFENFIDNVRTREQERAEKERLRKLFEDSLGGEDDGQSKSGT